MTTRKKNRREEILQALASMLESAPGERITTAGLAKAVGVSEAALYRHFPSKAKMFEGLIEFIEDSLLSRVNLIMQEEKDTLRRIEQTLRLMLVFAERNPGISRILAGDALQGEHERLRARIAQLYDKLETHIKQMLREKALREGEGFACSETMLANLLISYADGRISQFTRSGFKRLPSADFDAQWAFFAQQLQRS